MTSDVQDPLRERLEEFIGKPLGTAAIAPDEVNVPMIRHWVDALDDRNPVYLDEERAAARSSGCPGAALCDAHAVNSDSFEMVPQGTSCLLHFRRTSATFGGNTAPAINHRRSVKTGGCSRMRKELRE